MKLDKDILGIWKKISMPSKCAFFGAIVIGLLDYLYTITNHFLTFDSMWNQYSAQDMISSGRQFLTYACSISSYYDLPGVNGILAIFYIAITAALVVYIFELQSPIFAVLTGGILVTFPAVSSTFCYTYTVDGYMLALLLVTVAFVFVEKYRFGWILGAVLIGLSLGIYQAYYSFIILLCILKLLMYLVYEKDLKGILTKAGRYMLSGILGYLFYALTLTWMLSAKHMSLSGYQGSDKVLGFDLRTIPLNLYKATRNFFSFLVSMNVLTATRSMRIALGVIFLLGIAGFVLFIIQNKIYKNGLRMLLILLLVAITPAATTLVMVMAPDSYFHVLMRMPWSLFFVFALCIMEKISNFTLQAEGKWMQSIKQVFCLVVALSTAVLIFLFTVMQGIVAYNMNERYEKTYALCVRIVDRLEQKEEYQYGDRVAILGGGIDPYNYPPTSITGHYVGWYFGVNGELCASSTEDFKEFCQHFLGVSFVPASSEAVEEILQAPEYGEMGNFPDANSIQKIDDVWVVKLNG